MPEPIVSSTKIRHQNSFFLSSRPNTPCCNALFRFYFEFFLSPCLFISCFFSPCSSSTLLGHKYPLGHCNLHNRAGTVFCRLLLYTSVVMIMPPLRCRRHAIL